MCRLPENTPKNKTIYKAKGWFAGKSHMVCAGHAG
jgi:hypothetical protein